jgi:hypothetical protein
MKSYSVIFALMLVKKTSFMKNGYFPLLWLVLISCGFSAGCRNKKCAAPSLTVTPGATAANASPGEVFSLDIKATGTDNNNIGAVEVLRTYGGTTTTLLSDHLINTPEYKYDFSDTIPKSISYGATIIYTVIVYSHCTSETTSEFTSIITVSPSDSLIRDSVGTILSPKIYNRFTLDTNNNTAWQLEFTGNTGARFNAASEQEKDISDSTSFNDPYAGNVHWVSLNGTRFKKISGYDYNAATPRSVVDAWIGGGPEQRNIPVAAGDLIIANIQSANRFALLKILGITDTGPADNNDYVNFTYKLAR